MITQVNNYGRNITLSRHNSVSQHHNIQQHLHHVLTDVIIHFDST